MRNLASIMNRFVVIVFLFFTACSGVKITGVKKSNNFVLSSYKTFAFLKVDTSGNAIGPAYQDNLKLLKEAIAKQMSSRGLVINESNPDLLVNIGIAVLEKIQTRETNFSNPGDRTAYMGQRNYSWQSQEIEVGRYREGTVTIHLVDKAQNRLVWQGAAEGVIPEKQKNVPALIEESMAKLFEKIN